MLRHFELDKNELAIFRIWIGLMGFFIPFYGYVLVTFSDGAIDYMSHRFVISAYWFGSLALSFVYTSVARYLALMSYIGNFFSIAWIIWIVHVNLYSADYCMGLYLSLSGIGIINRYNWEMFSFYIFSFILIFISYYIQPDVHVSKMIFLLSVFITFLVHILIMGRRDFINQNLKLLNQRLQFKNNRLKEFLYAASHDLKTPIRGIGSFSSLLKEKIDSPEEKKYLGFILKNVVKMDKTLDDLMDFFKYDRDDLVFEKIDLSKIFNDIKESTSYKYPKENIELEIVGFFPSEIIANKPQIRQLFHSLIENSIKYNQSPIKQITLRYHDQNRFHHFSIVDNGIGIEKQHQHKIFGLFQRLHHEHEFSGTGVGLAVCKIIVENHKGEIWVEHSEVGKGTEFRFKIPKKL